MINEIEKVLIDTEELNEIVSRIAHEIDIDYAGEDRKLVLERSDGPFVEVSLNEL